ncbi:hypothetical protein FRC00_014068 [Tulasnella sp. 408]|nr:hypothetical protein FRC00_014068 [Tulasnella sp. 408]
MPTKIVDQILLVGDSITQGAWEEGGFAQRLAHVYARKLDVINRGLSGYNSEWAMPVFEQVSDRSAAVNKRHTDKSPNTGLSQEGRGWSQGQAVNALVRSE